MSRLPRPNRQQARLRMLRRIRSHLPFWEMMAQHGVDCTDTDTGPWLRGAEAMIFRALRRCAACRETASCRRWLGERHGVNEYAGFCPNGAAIETCRMLGPQGTRAPETREPLVSELLEDALIRQVMAADHVARATVERLLEV